MDISKLRVLLSVVDAGSFSKAAESLGYTQAGISYIISSLEEEIGIKLLTRTHDGIRLNSAGTFLIAEINRLVQDADSLENAISAAKKTMGGVIRIATIDTASIKWLPEAVSEFSTKHPDININITEGDPFEINDMIYSGAADLGITEKAWTSDEFTWVSLTDDPYYAVFPAGCGIIAPCDIHEFEGREFYIADFKRERNVPVMLRENSVKVEALPDRISTPAVIRSIEKGRGTTISSALAIYMSSIEALKNKPDILLLEPPAARKLGVSIALGKDENEIVLELIECLKSAVQSDDEWKRFISECRL